MQRFWDLIASLDLAEVSRFLLAGKPPMIVQLLALNTILLMLFVYRRSRGGPSRKMHAIHTVQWLLVVAIACVMLQDQWVPLASRSKEIMIDRYQHTVNP